MRILLVEDERLLSKALVKLLEKQLYSVDAVYNGADALDYIEAGHYDAVIMDIMMPIIDGMTALKTLRARGNSIPVLLLSAKSDVDDKVEGLDGGANYYLTKPFQTKELLAALRVITRAKEATDSTLTVGNITLNRASFELSSPCGSFRLANKEFQLMELFLSHPHTVLSSERLMETVWGYDSETDIQVVWVYISYLKKKLTALGATVYLKTTRNVGYSLEECHD